MEVLKFYALMLENIENREKESKENMELAIEIANHLPFWAPKLLNAFTFDPDF